MGFLWVWTHLLRHIHQSLNEVFVWLHLWELLKVSAKMILSFGTCKTYIVIDAFWRTPEVSGPYRPNQFKYSQVLIISFCLSKICRCLTWGSSAFKLGPYQLYAFSIHKQESMWKTTNSTNLICFPLLLCNLARTCVSMLVLVAFCRNTFLLGNQLHLLVTAE